MKLNVNKVLQQAAEDKVRVKPLPKVKVKGSTANGRHPVELNILDQVIIPDDVVKEVNRDKAKVDKEFLLKELWEEMGTLKRARGKLSSKTAHLVQEMEAMLQKENAKIASEFMAGHVPMPELASHAAEITSYTDQMAIVYDKIRHVEQYGELPSVITPAVTLNIKEQSIDVMSMHHEIRRLDDLIYKTNKKLTNSKSGIKKPKNNAREAEWNEKIALAKAAREDLKLKLKNVQYEAREQRTGTE